MLVAGKIEDWNKLDNWVPNQSCGSIVGALPTAATSNGRRDSAAGIVTYKDPAFLAFYRFTHCTKLPRALLSCFSSAPCNNYGHFGGFDTYKMILKDELSN